MIVISHPWEFVPKGNSHFNYHTGSLNNNNNNNNNDKPADSKNNASSNNAVLEMQQIQQQASHAMNSQQNQLYLQKSHLNRVFSNHSSINMRKNPTIISEDGNASINELSYGLMPKSPLITNINFEASSVRKKKSHFF